MKGQVCGFDNCPSRIYTEHEDGYTYCENGHQQSNILARGQDDDDFNPNARKVRAKKVVDEGDKVQQYFKGNKAFDLYLKCFQLILRHQLRFLIHSKGLPAELERVVLGLWALRIIQLEARAAETGEDTQSQMFTTSGSEKETEAETSRPSQRGRRLNSTPSLLDSLAMCYLGMHTMRLPITIGDILKWVTNGDMLYFRAIKTIPLSMKDRLPANYHASLAPNSVLKPETLHSAVLELAISYSQENGVIFPPRNHPLLLFRYLKELALPLEVYEATAKLASYLECAFTLPTESKKKLTVRDIPEAQLMSLLVVCVKLLYPFDEYRRYPQSAAEPSSVVLDWAQWAKHMDESGKRPKDSQSLSAEELLQMKEKDVFSMNDDMLDQYLDWYQTTWIDERMEEKLDVFQSAMWDMFPISGKSKDQNTPSVADNAPGETAAEMETVRAVHASLRARRVVTGEDTEQEVLRPGSLYKRYRRPKDLPEAAKRFFEEAASKAGLSLKMLTSAVFLTERKIQTWSVAQRKQQDSD